MRDERDGDPHVHQEVTAGGDAYVAARDIVFLGISRRLMAGAVLGVFAAAALSVGAWRLVAANDGAAGNGPVTGRQDPRWTQQQWARDVNAECRLAEPTLDKDLSSVTGLPPSSFESVPIDSRIPRGLQQLSADEAEITHLFQQVFPPPANPSTAVRQWLTDLSDRDVTLSKATEYARKISTDSSLISYAERIPTAYYVDKFVAQTKALRPIAEQLGIPNCV
jgi:hypothetical protein